MRAASAGGLLVLALMATGARARKSQRPDKAGAPDSRPKVREVWLGSPEMPTADDLLAQQEPVIVRGINAADLQKAQRVWSPAALRETKLHGAARGMSGGRTSQTRVMRYREHLEPALDSRLGFEWPRHKYDDWTFKEHTLEGTLDPPARSTYEMFSKSVAELHDVYPEGIEALYPLWLTGLETTTTSLATSPSLRVLMRVSTSKLFTVIPEQVLADAPGLPVRLPHGQRQQPEKDGHAMDAGARNRPASAL